MEQLAGLDGSVLAVGSPHREQLATVEAFDTTLAGHLDALTREPAAAHR